MEYGLIGEHLGHSFSKEIHNRIADYDYFLKEIGFQEVVTTKYVGDNGIDLTCSKSGIDPQGLDTMNYYVQAKRYKSTNKVQAKEIRDLKGSTKRDKQGNVLNNNYINEISSTLKSLLSYEEIISNKTNSKVAANIVNAILSRDNILFINPVYRFKLIESDPDDNKFVDCAIVANANYIVSEDSHFNVLKHISFPHINVLKLSEFDELMSKNR